MGGRFQFYTDLGASTMRPIWLVEGRQNQILQTVVEKKKLPPKAKEKKPTIKESIANLETQKTLAQMDGDTVTVKLIEKIIKRLRDGTTKND